MNDKLPIRPVDPTTIAASYRRIGIRPRMPDFGAWVEGVDLSGDLDKETCIELRRAWLEFGVIFFRSQQKLSEARQLELVRVFGSAPYRGNDLIERAAQFPDVERIVVDSQRRPYADVWHTDIPWRADPPIGTIIQIQEKPAVGGNTCWASVRTAYDCLSGPMKACLEGLTAIHWHYNTRARPHHVFANPDGGQVARALAADPPAEHPVVMTHPVTGRKSLYVNELFTSHIKDVHPTESSGLLRMLTDWLKLPEFQLHHEWEQNGVAVWDNFTVQHYANADYWPALRVNQRVTFSL